MKKEDAEYLLSRMNQEGFHYCFESYSNFEDIKDERFHKLRKEYLESAKKLKEYIKSQNTEIDTDEDLLIRGDVVVATWGYNNITKKPFAFLYEFGYYTESGKCVVYKQGECNMQDSSLFELNEVRLATDDDMNEYFWG